MQSLFYANIENIRLAGRLGKAINKSVANRLKKVNYPKLVEPFRSRYENDGYWRCEFWGKIVRSAILSWQITHDTELEQMIHCTVKDLLSTQTSDGRISTYPDRESLSDWDIWGRKYVLLALCRYYFVFGKPAKIAESLGKCLDEIINTLTNDINSYGQHDGLASSSILDAVIEIYKITGKPEHFSFAKQIVRTGGSLKHNIFEAARQGIKPADIGNGKAYEMMSCFQGLAELYFLDPQPEYRDAVLSFYRNARDREIFITGGAGLKDEVGEFFHDGKLRQTSSDCGGIGETCVSATWIHFCECVLKMTGDSLIADELERTFYNAVLGAMKPDGSWWSHVNPTPLTGHAARTLAKDQINGFGEDCCLAQGPEAIACASRTAIMLSPKGFCLNYYEAMSARLSLKNNTTLTLNIKGDYPRTGQVAINIESATTTEYEIGLRIPLFWGCSTIKLNGKELLARPGTYLRLKRMWHDDIIEIDFDLKVRVEYSLDEDDKVAFLSGPLLLAGDSRLNSDGIPIPAETKFSNYPASNLSNDVYLVKRSEDGVLLCDYASAGNLFEHNNTLCVWFPNKK